MQLTAGIAYLFARACSKRVSKWSPVTTPEGTRSLSDAMVACILLQVGNARVGAK